MRVSSEPSRGLVMAAPLGLSQGPRDLGPEVRGCHHESQCTGRCFWARWPAVRRCLLEAAGWWNIWSDCHLRIACEANMILRLQAEWTSMLGPALVAVACRAQGATTAGNKLRPGCEVTCPRPQSAIRSLCRQFDSRAWLLTLGASGRRRPHLDSTVMFHSERPVCRGHRRVRRSPQHQPQGRSAEECCPAAWEHQEGPSRSRVCDTEVAAPTGGAGTLRPSFLPPSQICCLFWPNPGEAGGHQSHLWGPAPRTQGTSGI